MARQVDEASAPSASETLTVTPYRVNVGPTPSGASWPRAGSPYPVGGNRSSQELAIAPTTQDESVSPRLIRDLVATDPRLREGLEDLDPVETCHAVACWSVEGRFLM
jgi:hypothetical protein